MIGTAAIPITLLVRQNLSGNKNRKQQRRLSRPPSPSRSRWFGDPPWRDGVLTNSPCEREPGAFPGDSVQFPGPVPVPLLGSEMVPGQYYCLWFHIKTIGFTLRSVLAPKILCKSASWCGVRRSQQDGYACTRHLDNRDTRQNLETRFYGELISKQSVPSSPVTQSRADLIRLLPYCWPHPQAADARIDVTACRRNCCGGFPPIGDATFAWRSV